MNRVKTGGFTLLELLLVIVVLGILGSIGFVSWQDASDRARVRDAATQLSVDLQLARSSTWRYNQDASFNRTSATTYTITVNGQARTRSLPVNTQFTFDAGAGPIGFTAPFAELDAASTATPPRLKVSLISRTTIPATYLKLIGVTGKVILSANP